MNVSDETRLGIGDDLLGITCSLESVEIWLEQHTIEKCGIDECISEARLGVKGLQTDLADVKRKLLEAYGVEADW